MENSNILIPKDEWVKNEEDGLWYVHIPAPFECDENTETILELADDDDYIDEHKHDFESLNNGTTGVNEVIISCDIQPSCDMHFNLKTLEEAGGRIMYDKNGNPEYIPEQSSFGGMFGALGGMMGGMPMIGGDMAGGLPLDSEGNIIDDNVIDVPVTEVKENNIDK